MQFGDISPNQTDVSLASSARIYLVSGERTK